MRAVHAAVAISSIVAVGVIAPACGGRGPLEDTVVIVDTTPDAAVPDAAPEAAPIVDASADVGPVQKPVDAGSDGGIIECGACLLGQCGQTILACVQNTSCRTIFQCVLTTCTSSGGGLDTACLLGCATGDLSGITQIFGVYQCLTATCGGDCNGVLGSLGGLGGGGGKQDGGQARAPDSSDSRLEQAFSPWPELFSHAK